MWQIVRHGANCTLQIKLYTHFPFHHDCTTIYSIKRSTVKMYNIESGRSVRIRSTRSTIWCQTGEVLGGGNVRDGTCPRGNVQRELDDDDVNEEHFAISLALQCSVSHCCDRPSRPHLPGTTSSHFSLREANPHCFILSDFSSDTETTCGFLVWHVAKIWRHNYWSPPGG